MANRQTRLELSWIGKENRPKLEPRIFVEDSSKTSHSAFRVSEADIFDNRLIFGDNLLALKALEPEFAGKVKCIYIDPPYNTGSAFEHYDDGLEHSLWLSMARDRIELLRRLLMPEGAIFVQVDDNEGQYLKVLMDELFGRQNFVATFIWRKVDSPNDNKVSVTPDHEYILCYAKDATQLRLGRKGDVTLLNAYRQRDARGRLYRDRLLKKNGKNSMREDRPSMFFSLPAPDGTEVYPIHDDGKEACWAMGRGAIDKLRKAGDLIWKNRGTEATPKWIPYSREYAPESPERPYPTIWYDLHTTRQAKAHLKEVLPDAPMFATPKPEPLIQRILELCTTPGELVLDSFLGSGTTAAVAHKMGRRWIGIELGEHCHTHVIPRLKKVIEGKDSGGVTEAVGWKGGGGFRYYRLAPSLLEKDGFGQWVISKKYNPSMLAEAICKLEGFSYSPSDAIYWQHGRSTENDFIYVTTQTLTRDQLQRLSDEVGETRSLLVMCGAFRIKNPADFPNLTLKKIPNAVLRKCEWGRDDYSLEIKSLPIKPEEEPEAPAPARKPRSKAERREQGLLFDVPAAGGGAP